jgi:sulfur-oxidizing protein SoxY
MERRTFIGYGSGLLALAALPAALQAKNYRKTMPEIWKITNDPAAKGTSTAGIDAAIKKAFGQDAVADERVSLKAPEIAENGAVVPIKMKADNATRIALFQSANPEALVIIFDVPKDALADYAVRIKMQQTGTVTAVAEVDGKLYRADKVVKVTVGGCGG